MALIVCEKCGNKISDTAQSCIHCGASLDSPAKTENEKIKFLSLNDEEQMKLEEEFWETDTEAFNWYQKLYERKKVYFLSKFSIIILSAMLVTCMMFIIPKLKYETAEEVKILMLIGLLFYLFACICAGVFSFRASYSGLLGREQRKKDRKKQCLYQKRFQRWLEKEKNIEFTPTMWTMEDKKFFNSVNMDYDKF